MFYQKFLKNKNKLRIIRSGLSWLLIILGLSILVFVWGPLVQQEIIFQYNKATGSLYYTYNRKNGDLGQNSSLEDRPSIVPKSTSFGIIIPKIGVNAPVFANINPFNEAEFLPILKKGIAHAKNTSFPGQGGNVYLFAHSANSALEIQRYNAVFYLVNKLEKGDQIVVYYKEKPHFYYVFEKKIVSPETIKYLKRTEEETLTLQTCYPPGTTLKRLIVKAKPEIVLDKGLTTY